MHILEETQCPKTSANNSSHEEDSIRSLSPEQSVNQESSQSLLAGSSIPSPAQVAPSVRLFPPISGSSPSLKLTNGMAAPSAQRMGTVSQIKRKPKKTPDHFAKRHKKPIDNKQKIKKLKYHQYIPPDQKGDKETPPHLDSSYAKILQQQQLFSQLQILSQQQQQQQHNYRPKLPKTQTAQQPSSSCPSGPLTTCSALRLAVAPSEVLSNQGSDCRQSCAPLCGAKPTSLPLNFNEMKVAELKSELKLRSLPVSGTKTDLIERLRTYRELDGGSDITSLPTAGGAEGAEKSSMTAATPPHNDTSQQPRQQHQFQRHPPSSLTSLLADTVIRATPAAGNIQHPATPTISLTLSDCSPGAMTPGDTSFDSEALGKMMNSPLTQPSRDPCSAVQLRINMKEESKCSTPTPCRFYLMTTPLLKHCQVSSTATTTAPAGTVDKDKMLQEKDKQIEELTRMLRQNDRLVEVMRKQLEQGKRGGQVPEPLILVKIKQLNKPEARLSSGLPPGSCDMDVGMVAAQQEATEEEEVVAKTADGLLQSLIKIQEVQMKSEQKNTETKQQHVCLQQTRLQFAQQQAIQKLLLQQQHNILNQQRTIRNRSQMLESQQNLQNFSQRRKKKAHKQELKQQQQLRQQIQLNQQKSFLQKPNKQQHHQTKRQQQIPIYPKIHLKQQQLLIQQNQLAQQQAPQVSQMYLNQQSAPLLPVVLLKNHSTQVTDNNHTTNLVVLTSNPIAPQRQTGGLEVSAGQSQREVCQCSSAPACLQPFFKDQETASSGTDTLSPSIKVEARSDLDVLFSPLSAASIRTAASPPDNKETEHEEDFIGITLQTGEMLDTIKKASDPSLDDQNPNSLASSPPPSPLQLLLATPIPPTCYTPQLAPAVQSDLQTLDDTTEEKNHLSYYGSGRLEDSLESTTSKPLLGGLPGGLSTLIDDLHNQILCTPNILDHPLSPMLESSSMLGEGENGLDSMDWLNLTMGGVREEEIPILGPLGPLIPPSVFSTDFLDHYDLQIDV